MEILGRWRRKEIERERKREIEKVIEINFHFIIIII